MKNSEIDAQELSDLIGLVYDSALEKNQWQSLITRVTEMFPGFFGWTSSFHNEYWLGMYTADGFNDLLLERWDAERTDEDRVFTEMPDELNDMRRVQRTRQKPVLGGILKSRDVFSDDELHSFNFYQQKMKPMGIGHWVGLAFAVSGPRYATIAFAEIDAMPVEKDYEGIYRLLELLSQHVVRAMRISRALHLAKQSAEAFQGFLDVMALPLVVCDADGIVQFGNKAGQRMIARGGVLKVRKGGGIALRHSYETKWLYRCFRDLEAEKQPTGLRLEDDAGPISLCVAPFHPRMTDQLQADRDIFENRTLFAIFAGTQGETAVNPGLLQDVFALTKREAEVSSHIVTGKTPAEIAKLTGRAEKTIRNQVQAVLEKVGVKSTGALSEALAVFRIVGAMYDPDDPILFTPNEGSSDRRLH
ncbi:helix-turn-helix transcriptional regulator [Aliiroseovarius sp. M344]|uniref:helix-turn-helix transcriptional regulator n=1 Tax=Aliiroseovarius sp. M344 TaxID=2867010 RepID=UPI0021AD9548|nr:helix-turn-helix transcriptional regulator [Aliiroseovarius sp. M344]UWQ15129.1 helix-turn-helix transcriptional regulator [Aliiroseovarius sp. M344]